MLPLEEVKLISWLQVKLLRSKQTRRRKNNNNLKKKMPKQVKIVRELHLEPAGVKRLTTGVQRLTAV